MTVASRFCYLLEDGDISRGAGGLPVLMDEEDVSTGLTSCFFRLPEDEDTLTVGRRLPCLPLLHRIERSVLLWPRLVQYICLEKSTNCIPRVYGVFFLVEVVIKIKF